MQIYHISSSHAPFSGTWFSRSNHDVSREYLIEPFFIVDDFRALTSGVLSMQVWCERVNVIPMAW